MSNELSATLAGSLGISARAIEATKTLLDEGATIPFISRYRKEATGGLDEVQLRAIEKGIHDLKFLNSRKEYILNTIKEQGVLNDQLEQSILRATDITSLEDLYLPYRKKRKTRATKAKELGLEPLASIITTQGRGTPEDAARSFVTSEVPTIDDALAGASDIIAEQISEMPWVRQSLRNDYLRHALIKSTIIKGKEREAAKFEDYFHVEERINRTPSHRLLAILRGEQEGFLRVNISIDQERSLSHIKRKLINGKSAFREILEGIVEESFKRLIAPSLETEAKNHFKEQADVVAIEIFVKNLKQLLLAAPAGEKAILAIDPGFRTGCKVVVLSPQGDLEYNTTIFPHPPQRQVDSARDTIERLCEKYGVEALAIGNGTAGRETLTFAKGLRLKSAPKIYMVNESGASIYSASDLARAEFPDQDVTVRGAISIGRRLMDPLAELVKIDAKSIGVGQYQHDVNQKLLQESLEKTVSSCVNRVGINLNTASTHLLEQISGLGPALAQNIVDYRKTNGPFKDKSVLKDVPRLGAKAFEQSAGFVRIRNGENPLDNTAVHPESYGLVKKMAKDLNCTLEDLINQSELRKRVNLQNYISEKVGLPTLRDIMSELEKPGLDPRGVAKVFEFNENVRSMSDLELGMQLPGIVTNLTNFGVFVDIGVKQDGMIHVSQLGNPPRDLHLQEAVYVRILAVDQNKKRISLQLVP